MNRDIIQTKLLQESTWAWIGLVVAIMALAYVIYRIRAWYREDEDEGPAGGIREMLAEAAEMHRTGAISDAEYRSIQSRLSHRMGKPSPVERGLSSAVRTGATDGSVKETATSE